MGKPSLDHTTIYITPTAKALWPGIQKRFSNQDRFDIHVERDHMRDMVLIRIRPTQLSDITDAMRLRNWAESHQYKITGDMAITEFGADMLPDEYLSQLRTELESLHELSQS